MAFKLGYCTLRWRNPDLEAGLTELKKAGWDGWECRLPLEWLGTPARVRRVCENADMPLAVYSALGSPEGSDAENFERNKRRMEFAAEVGADCYLYMSGRKEPGHVTTEDEIKAAAAAADEWAEYAKQFGLELTYHIHTNLLVDSVDEWKSYMKHLNVAGLCIDVSHAKLWGYEENQSLRDFKDQLNYVHLQDYSSTSRRDDGYYLPIWVDVGQGQNCDFAGIKNTLEEIKFDRWVTACPGEPIPGQEDEISESRRSARMVKYLRDLGY